VERIGELQTRLAEICDPNGDGIEGKDRWGKTSFDLLSAVILHVMYKKRAENSPTGLALAKAAIESPQDGADSGLCV
jgi:hypothetical protein